MTEPIDSPGPAPSRAAPGKPGKAGTKARILAAARELFAQRGFTGVTVREIAGAADADPALINHHFGGKEALFRTVMEIPLDPVGIISSLVDGTTVEDLPRKLTETYFGVWEDPITGPAMQAVVRRAMTDPRHADQLQSFLFGGVLEPLLDRLPWPTREESRLRVTLAMSELVGAMIARHIFRAGPLAELPRQRHEAILVPVISHHLLGKDLP